MKTVNHEGPIAQFPSRSREFRAFVTCRLSIERTILAHRRLHWQ
jgi:hypothetical protein